MTMRVNIPLVRSDRSAVSLEKKKISITDTTLRRATETGALGFKEKLEIAKCLDRVNISAMELAPLGGSKADSIFVKTLASLIHNTTLALPVGLNPNGVEQAWDALKTELNIKVDRDNSERMRTAQKGKRQRRQQGR